MTAPVTIERLDRARRIVADMMVRHDMPELIVTIRHLEAEQDKLRQQTRQWSMLGKYSKTGAT
jgi:hypothetical protein